MMHPLRASRRGTALVIAVGLMSVLAVIGFGFAVVMRLHYETSRYFRANSQIELLTHAAIYYSIHEIRYGFSNATPAPAGVTFITTGVPPTTDVHTRPVGAVLEPTDSPRNPWYVGAARVSSLTDDGATPRTPRYFPEKGHSYALVHDILGDQVALTYVNVFDCSSKINVNDNAGDAVLKNMLGGGSGSAGSLFYELNVSGENTGAGAPPAVDAFGPQDSPGTILTGDVIITYRNTLPNQRFTTLRQLAQVPGMSERRFDVLQHYLTIHSWPHKPVSVQGYVPGIVNPGSGGLDYSDGGSGRYRSPININTAPFEVLVAMLANVKVPDGAGGHASLGAAKARHIAEWIVRKRDPENLEHWEGDLGTAGWATWKLWLEDNSYHIAVRNAYRGKYYLSVARAFPLGPFDSFNEIMAFLYWLTDTADSGADKDPFPEVIDVRDAEAIIAATNRNTFASVLALDTAHMCYTRGGGLWGSGTPTRDVRPEFRNLDDSDDFFPLHVGKDDLAASAITTGFCYSGMGRYNISTRTFAFVKADVGKATGKSDYGLTDGGKSWGTAPAQWRGYSVLIYDGKGMGILRGIVANTRETITVAKWSQDLETTSGTDQSRYYICGPGPMVDRVDEAGDIDVTNGGAFLRDREATWEDDQWNGYRVVVYRAGFDTETIETPGGPKTIQHEAIASTTIQERFIVDTVGGGGGRTPRLVVSPELVDESATPNHWSYIILGSHGGAAHETVVKAYDVIHHTSEDDFAGGHTIVQDAGGNDTIAIGPNPKSGTRSKIDGFLSVAREPVEKPDTVTNAFVLNYGDTLNPTEGGTYASGNATIGDVYQGANLAHDGLYLRRRGEVGGDKVGYNINASVGIVTQNTESEEPTDGGFVSFWYRPDTECLKDDTEQRTLVRIVGNAVTGELDDIRVQMVGTTLRLVVRASGNANYMKLQTSKDPDTGEPIETMVKCRQFTFVPPAPPDRTSVSVNVSDVAYSAIYKPWQAGSWHHIAFAWYESFPYNPANNDGNPDTDPRCDGPAGNPDYNKLDDMQVRARLKLWVDGILVKIVYINAFNLLPPPSGGILHIGEQGHPPGGTIDGILAYAHNDKNLVYLDVATSVKIPVLLKQYHGRYYGLNPSAVNIWADSYYGTYTSPPIQLPGGVSGRSVCLGTASVGLLLPQIAKHGVWVDSRKYPCTISVSLNGTASGAAPGWVQDAGEGGGQDNEAALCAAVPLRDVSTVPEKAWKTGVIQKSSATTIRYTIKLSAFHLDGTGLSTSAHPRFWQTPIVEDVTITYLGPLVFLHWK